MKRIVLPVLPLPLGLRAQVIAPTAKSIRSRFRQPNLNTGLIREISIPFPPPPEQRDIAETLGNMDALLGSLIWHTQGSGKSIVMVLLANWILENKPNARVLIITERDELDKQIEGVFKDAGEPIYRTTSGHDLMAQLGQGARDTTGCTLQINSLTLAVLCEYRR